jgi:hypothetical protein
MRAGIWWKTLAALGVILALGAGCSSGAGEKTSSTPPVESTANELEPGLLTLQQVRTALALPNYRRTKPEPMNLRDNPDPRGPCGAKIADPPYDNAAVATFRDKKSVLVEVVVEPGERKASDYIAALQADSKPGCPPFESKTNTGATQRMEPTMVPLPPTADGASAVGGIVTVGSRRAVLVGVVVRDGGRLAISQLVAGTSVSPEAAISLARESAKALERLDRSSA